MFNGLCLQLKQLVRLPAGNSNDATLHLILNTLELQERTTSNVRYGPHRSISVLGTASTVNVISASTTVGSVTTTLSSRSLLVQNVQNTATSDTTTALNEPSQCMFLMNYSVVLKGLDIC